MSSLLWRTTRFNCEPTLYLIYFNDFSEILKYSDVIQFADDAVIFVSVKDVQSLQSMLNKDVKSVSKFFTESELILNLKAVKTECMLLRTSWKLSRVCNQIQLFHNSTPIQVTKSYKYLGTSVNPYLHLGEQFDKTFKKMSTKLKLLKKLKHNLTNEATKSIMVSLIQHKV